MPLTHSHRIDALIQEAYRIGMQQVLSEVREFADLIVENAVANALEIGSNSGGMFFLVAHLAKPGVKVVLDKGISHSRSQMLLGLPGEIHEHVIDSHEPQALSQVEACLEGRLLDLLFIDGDHSYDGVKQDYEMYRHLVRPGGMIAFHDVRRCEYNTRQGIEVPALWAEIERVAAPSSVLILLSDSETSADPKEYWAWSSDYARKAGIPPVWGGIGVIFTQCDADQSQWVAACRPPSDPIPSANTTDAERPHLVYCPTNRGDFLAEIDGANRLFDVALNDYSGEGVGIGMAEWQFTEKLHKWPGVAVNLPSIHRRYQHIAFLDNDVSISTAQLNALFLIGSALRLDLFQASLSEDSHSAYPQLRQRPDSYIRKTRFVEIMMPIFSWHALECCRFTFTESVSGWGLDLLWAKILGYEGMAVVDSIVAGHRRPRVSHRWRIEKGQSAQEEMVGVCRKFGVRWASDL